MRENSPVAPEVPLTNLITASPTRRPPRTNNVGPRMSSASARRRRPTQRGIGPHDFPPSLPVALIVKDGRLSPGKGAGRGQRRFPSSLPTPGPAMPRLMETKCPVVAVGGIAPAFGCAPSTPS